MENEEQEDRGEFEQKNEIKSEDIHTKKTKPAFQERVISQPSKVEKPSTYKNGYMNSSIGTIEEEDSMVSEASLMMSQKINSISTEGDPSKLRSSNIGSFPTSKRMKYAKSSISSEVVQNKTNNPLPYPNIIEEESAISENSSSNKDRRTNYAK
jgi:hypothetical protein